MADEKKVLDQNGLLYYHRGLKQIFVQAITYDGTNKKFVVTKNGIAADLVTASTLKSDMALNNVGNFKAVSTVANQGLTETEKANARANIGAGSSGFSGDFTDLTNVPTTISGYGITDANIANGVITLGSNTITPITQHQDISGKADVATTLSGYGITDANITNGTITLGSASFKGVSVAANQGLTAAEQENARANLGIMITELYKFKGSVATVAALDAIVTKAVGDVYNVTANGKNYAWTGTEWDDLGGEFSITAITNSEIDTILAD